MFVRSLGCLADDDAFGDDDEAGGLKTPPDFCVGG